MKKNRQPTEVAKTLSSSDTQEDTVAKRLFSINEIIAWVLKLCIEEFSMIDVQYIVNEWLAKADKRIGTEPVLPDVPSRRSAIGTEDKSKTDGTVYFDFRTEIPLPNAPPNTPVLVIDMELQNEYRKRFALHKRSVYYNCRLISSQPGRLTGGKIVYPRLCRTCGIWIYPNAPKRLANHVRKTTLTEENIVGMAPLSDGEDEANQLMGIWKIYIRDSMPPSKDQKILWLFYVLFTRTMTCDEKMKILVRDFDMKATEEVEKMCSFTEMISREQRREGRIEGKKEGIVEGMDKAQLIAYTNMKNAAYDDQTICSMLGITLQKIRKFKKILSGETDLTPKTV